MSYLTYLLFLIIFILFLFFIDNNQEGFTPQIRQQIRPVLRSTKKAKETFSSILNTGVNKVKSSLGLL